MYYPNILERNKANFLIVDYVYLENLDCYSIFKTFPGSRLFVLIISPRKVIFFNFESMLTVKYAIVKLICFISLARFNSVIFSSISYNEWLRMSTNGSECLLKCDPLHDCLGLHNGPCILKTSGQVMTGHSITEMY